jgi:hypothetical protein
MLFLKKNFFVILNAVKDLFADLQGEEAWRTIDPSLRSG